MKSLIIVGFSLIICFTSCKKDWLDEKRDIHTVIPTTLSDMRLLLNNTNVFGYDFNGIAHVSADEYYFLNSTWQALTIPIEKNAYIWDKDLSSGIATVNEWNSSYNQVLVSNIILEGIDKIDSSVDLTEWRDVKGGALFFRAKAFYNLAQLYAKPYSSNSAVSDLGISLKLTPDINSPTIRNTVQETYDRIAGDLRKSVDLLKKTPIFKTDASKAAALGLLARCYLSERNYDSAFIYSDLCLKMYDSLMNYNKYIPVTTTYPFQVFNSEVIFQSYSSQNYSAFATSKAIVDTTVYKLYDLNDLRRSVFFLPSSTNATAFRGNYSGSLPLFSGIAADEMYLIRAECYARKGDLSSSLANLNTLLINRWKTGTFVPVTATNATDALNKVLLERRKELLYRTLRWTDLRRLNFEDAYKTTITRMVNNQTYTLTPNDSKYVLPIPDYIVQLTGISQNERY